MKNFNRIVAGFQKTLKQLDALIQQNDRQVEDNMETIHKIRSSNLTLTAEKQAAVNVSNNLRRMLEGGE